MSSCLHSSGRPERDLQFQWLFISCRCTPPTPNLQTAFIWMTAWVCRVVAEPGAADLGRALWCHGRSCKACLLTPPAKIHSFVLKVARWPQVSPKGQHLELKVQMKVLLQKEVPVISVFRLITRSSWTLLGFLPVFSFSSYCFNCLLLCSYYFNFCLQKSNSSRQMAVDVTAQLNAGCKASWTFTLKQSSTASK